VLELEWGLQALENRDCSSDRLMPTQFNLGLSPWLDVRLGWNGPLQRRDSGGEVTNGASDWMAGGQGLFLRQAKAGLDLGFSYWHKVPATDSRRGLCSGRHDDSLVLTASRTHRGVVVDVNAGFNWIGRCGGPGRVRQGVASLAVTVVPARDWNLTLDTCALAATELGPRTVSSILAMSRNVGPNLCLDAAVEAGLTRKAPRLALNLGLVWRLGRLW
jgi:hypothetical protein